MFKFNYFKYSIFLFTLHSLNSLTTLEVTLSSDNNPGGMGEIGDLRYCLNSMNQSLNTTPDDYTIVFAFPMNIQLNGILPIINNSTNPVSITLGNPSSAYRVIIDGNGLYNGLFIPIGNVTIQNMVFQNLVAKGGNGGDGISGGGGGMGAGGAIYAPQTFLNGSNPSITLINVLINNCSAVGGNGGNYLSGSPTGNEGGGGGGGFSGNGGSITINGNTGGAGGGGFGGDGGNVVTDNGGGGGGGGIGSRATIGTPANLGNGGSDQNPGSDGSGYYLNITAGAGSGGNAGGTNSGGGGGGGTGGGGGGSGGQNGLQPQGTLAPGGSPMPSGGNGGDGGGAGGAGIVMQNSTTNNIDGQAGNGGYGGGGGGGAGTNTGAYDTNYTVEGGSGGIGGGGGGGGVNKSGNTPAGGGNSQGGGGGAGGGPSNGLTASGGTDIGNLGGGSGGNGANTYGSNSGGGGGGGGSGLGGAIFVDTSLNFTIQALSGTNTTFNTSNNTTQAGVHGNGGPGGSNGTDGSALGNSIFLRTNSSLTFIANNTNDLLTLGTGVSFVDDTTFGAGGTNVFVKGNGTVIYNGTTDYQGSITINNANFKVNGQIDEAAISVCRNISFSSQRGTLSGIGRLTGNVLVNSGTISPDAGKTLTLGNLTLNSADPVNNTLGSLVHIEIDANNIYSSIAVSGPASLAGTLEIDLDSNALPGTYKILNSSGITGSFDSVTFTGNIPNYSLSYLPIGSPTFVQFDFLGYPSPSISSFTSNPITINEGDSSTLTVTFSGGTAPYTASWSDGTVNNNVTSPLTHLVSPTTTTPYNVTITDANGNYATSDNVTVIVKDPTNELTITSLTANPSIITPCQTSTLIATFTGGTGPYTASWSDGFINTNITSPTTQVVSPNRTTSYSVTITDKNNNQASESVIVWVQDEMIRDAFMLLLLQKYAR